MDHRVGLLRSSAAAGGFTAVALALAAAAHEAGLSPRGSSGAGGALTVDGLVAAAVFATGAVAAAVLALGCSLLAVSALVERCGRAGGRLHRAGARLTPVALRRCVTVTVATGLGLGIGVPAATADELDIGWTTTSTETSGTDGTSSSGPDTEPSVDHRTSSGGTTPSGTLDDDVEPVSAPVADASGTRSAGASPAGEAADAAEADADADIAETYTVVAGDSLWSIAAAHLPADASDADVTAAWPTWYTANRDVVGADPDLILPGQTLRVPADALTEEHA